ncbi:hypothetical protein [Klebsiella pneumoniae]|uniref:hypothetical protein n=1 Tax=Klebsiella pneumoniae TaxID=573 RepID=UPI0022B73643|nr:hypothetical protein [Klebsiella pneumoniae]
MPQVTISAGTARFTTPSGLSQNQKSAARKGGEVIVRAIQQLKTLPDIGRPVPFLPLEYRNW